MAEPPMYRDPWAKREAWRKDPRYFGTRYFIRHMFPGFGIAVVAFSVYVAYDNLRLMSSPPKEAHH